MTFYIRLQLTLQFASFPGFHGGFYNSTDGTVFGQKVDVKADPLYDATYGYSYDPPNGQDIWGDADMTAGQKTMLSQRGVSTTYKRWGV